MAGDVWRLLDEARAAMNGAYAPYSRFRVGAALLVADGRVFHGANVENASYGLSICAERLAACRAVTAGTRDFEMLAVVCSSGGSCLPCGACRQFLAEFARELPIATAGPDGTPVIRSLTELLPDAFTL